MVIALKPVEGSAQILAHGYDATSQVLAVQFKNGTVYHVKDVDEKKAKAFANAPSLGKHYNAHIRGQHPFEKIETEAETAGAVDGEGSEL